jgi:hypothetical protein
MLLVSTSRLDASIVIAEWNPNSESNIAGYLLSYGMQSGNYTTTMDIGNVTTYSFSLTAGQTYYLAVQAYNTNSQVSPYSAEVVYTVPADAPTIVSLSPASGSLGTPVTISGSNFGATEGVSTVGFSGITASPTSWSNTAIVAPVPPGATTGNVVVTVGGVASNGAVFTISTVPAVAALSPLSGLVGTVVTISGANFGQTQGTSTVTFNGVTATPASWSNSGVIVAVPKSARTGSVVITVGGVASNGLTFTVTAKGHH